MVRKDKEKQCFDSQRYNSQLFCTLDIQTKLMEAISLNNKKTVHAWAMFDWANSAYALVISTAIFPGYFEEYSPKTLSFGQFTFSNTALFSFSVSFAFIVIGLLSPLMSGIADASGRRLFFLRMFTLIGSVSCSSLFFFDGPEVWWLGTGAFILATIGFAGSLVFYDSFLPLIATEDKYNELSARGFTLGYIGSVLLLICILLMILQPAWFLLPNGQMGARVGFLLVGVWWLGFSQYTFAHLPADQRVRMNGHILSGGYREIMHAFANIRQLTELRTFLLAFFFYSAGVQTVIYLATLFAKKELGFGTSGLILVVLILQLVAIGGARLFSWLGNVRGNRFSILVMIAIWIFICGGAFFTYDKMAFYVLAGLVGMVMGGIQSLSRASYSFLIPEKSHDTTSYFSFYDVVYKMAIVGGTFLFGLVDNLTQNMRYSVLVLALLFVVGMYFMSKTRIESVVPKEV
jgi:UMF1 family MFS transporter